MTTQLMTRLVAVGLASIPLAWLWMNHAHRLATGQEQLPTPTRTHGFVFYFIAVLVLGVVYLVLIEGLAFVISGSWRKHGTGTL